MPWFYLYAAIFCELAGTISLKMSEGFSKLIPSIMMVAFYIPAFWMLGLATKTIEVGTAYAIWSGLGTALMAIVGIVFFKELLSVPKVVGLLLVIGGVVVLNRSGA